MNDDGEFIDILRVLKLMMAKPKLFSHKDFPIFQDYGFFFPSFEEEEVE